MRWIISKSDPAKTLKPRGSPCFGWFPRLTGSLYTSRICFGQRLDEMLSVFSTSTTAAAERSLSLLRAMSGIYRSPTNHAFSHQRIPKRRWHEALHQHRLRFTTASVTRFPDDRLPRQSQSSAPRRPETTLDGTPETILTRSASSNPRSGLSNASAWRHQPPIQSLSESDRAPQAPLERQNGAFQALAHR